MEEKVQGSRLPLTRNPPAIYRGYIDTKKSAVGKHYPRSRLDQELSKRETGERKELR